MDISITINLRGRRFEVQKSTLQKFENSKLALLSEESNSYCHKDGSYYFDVNPVIFDCILDAYSSPEVHIPRHVCLGQVCEQLTFWRLDDSILAPCCWNRYKKHIETEQCMERIRREMNSKTENTLLYFSDKENLWKLRLYRFFEIPDSSKGAKMWSIFIMTMVIASVLLAMIEVLEPCRRFVNSDFEEQYKTKNESRLRFMIFHTVPKPSVSLIDFLITFMLTLDLMIRFIASPFRNMFFTHKHLMNIFDLLGVVPIWLRLVIVIVDREHGTLSDNTFLRVGSVAMGVTKIFRLLRLFRIIDHYKALKLIHLAMNASKREMALLVILLSLMACIFANFVFISELHRDTFSSPFHALWWAIITMTTVGYGDVYPTGVAGCIVGSICAVMGILVIALPVPVIVNNFSTLYDCSQRLDRLAQRHNTHVAVQ